MPTIQRLLATSPRPAPTSTSILVLSPTRELALQIGVAAEGLLKGQEYKVKCVVGGTNIDRDIKDLKNHRYVPLLPKGWFSRTGHAQELMMVVPISLSLHLADCWISSTTLALAHVSHIYVSSHPQSALGVCRGSRLSHCLQARGICAG